MKLYATTTSERATKGQGGNNFIECVLRDEDQAVVYEFRACFGVGNMLLIKPLAGSAYALKGKRGAYGGGGYVISDGEFFREFDEAKKKGKKQKGV